MNHSLKVQPASSQHYLQVDLRTTIFHSEVYHHPKGSTIFRMVVAIRKTRVQKYTACFVPQAHQLCHEQHLVQGRVVQVGSC